MVWPFTIVVSVFGRMGGVFGKISCLILLCVFKAFEKYVYCVDIGASS